MSDAAPDLQERLTGAVRESHTDSGSVAATGMLAVRHSLTTALETVLDALAWKDLDGHYLACNAAFAELVGLDAPEEIRGRSDLELAWEPDQARRRQEADLAAIRDARTSEVVEPVTDAEGSPRWLQTRRVPLRTDAGEVWGLLIRAHPIGDTDPEPGRESKSRLRSVLQSHPDGIVLVDREGMVLFASQHTGSAITGSSILDHVEEDTAAELQQHLARVFRGQELLSFEMQLSGPVSVGRWFRAHVGPVVERGQVVAATIVAHDITAERERERELQQTRRLLGMLADAVPSAVFHIDPEGRFCGRARGGLLSRFGVEPGQMEGLDALDVYGDLPGFREMLRRALDGETVHYESELQGVDMNVWLVPVLDHDRRVVRVDGIAVGAQQS